MIVTGNEFSGNTGTQKEEQMAEMEALLQQAAHFIPETDEPSWHQRARAILAPAPDPDALAKEIFAVGNAAVGPAGGMQAERADLSLAGHARYRAIAAWVEADRVKVRHAALTEAALVVEREHLPKRYILALRDGGDGSRAIPRDRLRPNVGGNPMSTGHIQTPRDELRAAVVAALEDAMCEFPHTAMKVAFRAIEAHAGGCWIVPKRPADTMITAGRRSFGQVVDIIIAANAASPYAPEVKP